MDDLVRWLHDQLGTDERLAVLLSLDSSVPDQWEAKRTRQYNCGEFTIWSGERKVAAEALEASAFHIARHDPARVLREIEAKRAIVARYEFACREASRVDLAEDERETWVRVGGALQAVVIQLAAPYADRPGYKAEEWAP